MEGERCLFLQPVFLPTSIASITDHKYSFILSCSVLIHAPIVSLYFMPRPYRLPLIHAPPVSIASLYFMPRPCRLPLFHAPPPIVSLYLMSRPYRIPLFHAPPLSYPSISCPAPIVSIYFMPHPYRIPLFHAPQACVLVWKSSLLISLARWRDHTLKRFRLLETYKKVKFI